MRRNGIDDGLQQAVAVAISVDNRVVAQYRERPGLMVQDGVRTFIPFPDAVSVRDTGHAVFHAGTPTGLACASCHPEGGEDGRTWNFIPLGARRTPTMRGATSATAPFHWDGDQRDLTHLLGDVFAGRMGAGELNPAQQHSLSHWIDGLPTLRTHATADADTLARGRAVFEGPAGCADCHSGAALTNNDTVDVGTGGSFQVPQLHGLAARAPYLHDGRAATLDLRLMMNDGDRHGHTSTLTPAQRADLLRYLASL
ncbi:MAG: cytochrome c [Polyangiales bacterium]